MLVATSKIYLINHVNVLLQLKMCNLFFLLPLRHQLLNLQDLRLGKKVYTGSLRLLYYVTWQNFALQIWTILVVWPCRMADFQLCMI